MKLKEIYNPKPVYEGFFETYFIRPFFHHYADFAGKEAPSSCLRSLLAWLIVSLGIAGIMMGQIGLIGPEAGISATYIVCGIWIVASVIPLLAIIVRTSHGSPAKVPAPKMLGVDVLLGVSCLLFFVLGLLMMTTTLASGALNPNAGATDEPDSALIEEEHVTEEPIFTYQDEAPATAETDSLSDMTEPDLVDPDDSYDPTLDPAASDPDALDATTPADSIP